MKQIGPYLIEGNLGRGAMGEVYLARHPDLDAQYALKVLPRALLEDEDSFRRFELEISTLAQVDGHPGIVRVHSAGRTDDGQPYYVMELVSGRTLREAFKEGIPLEETLRVLEEVAQALEHAHGHGVIHRDVKPANVLLGEDGVIRLTDFGLARALDQQVERLTRTGDMVGTPAYMAPEQAASKLGAVGPWTDVWGLGAILYEALVGHVPYPGETSVEIYSKLVEGAAITPPHQLQPQVPAQVEAVCLAALVRDPQRRLRSAGEMAQALRRARLGEEEPPQRPVALTTLLGGLAALSLLLAALAVGALLIRARGRSAARAELEVMAQARAQELAALRGVSDPEAILTRTEALLGARDPAAEALEPRLRQVYEAIAQLRAQALERRVTTAWAAGDARLARERLRDAEGVALSARPWILACAGEPAAALEHVTPGDDAARARLAAWAGDAATCAAALARLATREPARARALSLRLRGALAGLTPVGLAEGSHPWAGLARAEESLAAGDPGLAAVELEEARPRAQSDPDALAAAELLAVRLALARGDAAAAALALREGWNRARELDPLLAAECLGWAALLAARDPGLRLPGLGDDLRAEAQRRVPGGTAALTLAGAGDPIRAALRRRAPDALPAGTRSALSAELALGAAGRDGPAGLLLARAAGLTDQALEGGDAAAGEQAAELAELAATLRPDSPAALLVQARARRAAGDPARAEELAGLAARAAPGDPLALLELARARLGRTVAERQVADLARAKEATLDEAARAAAEPQRREAEMALADRLQAAALELRAAREAATGDPLEETARLEGAAVWAERAHRLGRGGAQAELVAAARGEARAELGPLLRRVPLQELQASRRGLLSALQTAAPDRAGAVREAELALARVVSGVDARAREAAFLAATTAGADGEARDWAGAWLALAGDLPARALLALRRGEAATDLAQRRRELAHALALLPQLPRALVSQEGLRLDPQGDVPKPGQERGSALTLARVAEEDPEEIDHARALLALASADPSDLAPALARLEEDAGAGADPALVHLARALLLLEVGGEAAAKDAARSSRAAREAGAALRLRPSVAAHLLLARALARLGEAARPDALHHLRCARSGAPWAAPALWLELELSSGEEEARATVDRLLAGGCLTAPGRLRERVQGQLRSQLERIEQTVTGLGLGSARSAFDWAGALQGGDLRLAGLMLRLRTGAEVWNAYDRQSRDGGRREDPLRALEPWPARQAAATAVYRLFRALKLQHREVRGREERGREERERRQDGDRQEELTEALQASCRALAGLAPPGAADLPDLARLDGRGVPCEGEVPLERDARRRGHPAEEGLRDWSRRLLRAEHASLVRARAWARLSRGTPPAALSQAGLADPWGRGQALLRTVQDGDFWPVDVLVEAGELDEARLAMERDAAFSRAESPGDAYYWRLLWNVRWTSAEKDEVRLARRRMALEACRTPQVEACDPGALRPLHVDLLLDLAAAAPAGSPERAALVKEAQGLIDALPERSEHDDSTAVSDLRRAKALALAGQPQQAKKALQRVLEAIKAERDDGLREVCEQELTLVRTALLAALPELGEVYRKKLE